MTELKRLDPIGCGCTDCLTGYSKPIDMATDDELIDALQGNIENASNKTIQVKAQVIWH